MTARLEVEVMPQQDKRLGRQKVHDPASRGFVMPRATIDRSSWKDKAVRIYDPTPNPNQCHGECTGCAECMMLNAVGNRVSGRIMQICDAHWGYADASQNDPWSGGMTVNIRTCTLSGQDTGSSGLAAAKAAIKLGWSTEYRWEFGGADGVVQQVQEGRVLSVGTWWHADMFGPSGGTFDGLPIVSPTGGLVGGHQYVIRGYDVDNDRVLGRCWWGGFRDFWMKRDDLDDLLRDGGDAHFSKTV